VVVGIDRLGRNAAEVMTTIRELGEQNIVLRSLREVRLSHFRPQAFGPAVERLMASGSEFPRVTPHDLRHTAASLAISGGANPKAVQTMLGHQSAALTLDIYADLFPDDLELVSAVLDQARQAALNATADQLRTGTQQTL
jgi:integrase